jgi:hypothetical protein
MNATTKARSQKRPVKRYPEVDVGASVPLVLQRHEQLRMSEMLAPALTLFLAEYLVPENL